MNSIQSLCYDFTAHITKQRDSQIEIAINAALGHDQWTLGDLKGRMRREIHADVETFFLDGTPIIEINMRPSLEFSEDGRKITANWSLRQLARSIEQQGNEAKG